jgi:hypothetical protein
MWAWSLRDRGRAAVASGKNTGVAYFEFTIPDDADPEDETVWWDYYPALADGLVRVQELRADLERLGVESFAAEYLGRWPTVGAARQWSAIDRDQFAARATTAELDASGVTVLGVDIDPFGRSSTITAATERDGAMLVEVIDHRPGSAWVPDQIRLLASSAGLAKIAIDDYGPGHDLIYALTDDPLVSRLVISTKAADFAAACYVMDRLIREGGIEFRTSSYYDVLAAAAAAAERTTGKSWQWERRVSVSQTPIVSATLAAWSLGRATDGEFFVF